ncbi:MAG: ribosome biogenesis GTPase Der [Rectinemataceae bacterium]
MEKKTSRGERIDTATVEEGSDAAPATRVRYENLPIVVIAGRPNVGKSTLYNRLLHKRRAITEPTPGVTRDAVDSVCELRESGRVFRLIDTGGFKLERRGLDELVVAKSLASIEGADLILFLVDAMSITPEDEEFAALLRKWTPKVLLVVNKADSPDRDADAWTHASWGFDPVVFVSAEHGRNIGFLEAEVVSRLDFSRVVKVDEERSPIRLAIMGKPNTGKSTLLNRLVGEEKSIVSEVAGTTRDIVEGSFERKGRRFTVLDTAGIRRKGKVTENVEYYSVHRAIHVVEDCDVVVLMIDAVEGLTDQDKKIAAFAVEEGRGVILALNKWDTMPDLKNSFEAARDKLRFFFGQMAWAPVIPLSAKKGEGMDKLVSTIITLHAQLNKRIETSKLNKAIEAWVERTPPPVGPRTRFKLRYAVQTSVNPQKFVIFASRPDAVTEAYVSFLRNKIRDELGMDMIPLTLEVKASHVPIVRPAPTRAEKMKEAAKRPVPAPRAGTSKKVKREVAAHQGPSARIGPAEKRAAAAKKKAAGRKENAAKKTSDAQRGVVGNKALRSAAGRKAGVERKGAVVKGSRSSSRAVDPRKRERRDR